MNEKKYILTGICAQIKTNKISVPSVSVEIVLNYNSDNNECQ